MKKEVNRALVAKKMYVTPLVEATQVHFSGVIMVSPPTTPVPPAPPAPRPRGGKLW